MAPQAFVPTSEKSEDIPVVEDDVRGAHVNDEEGAQPEMPALRFVILALG